MKKYIKKYNMESGKKYNKMRGIAVAALLCAGLVLAGCGTQEAGQTESRQQEQAEEQTGERSEERSEERPEGQAEEEPGGQREGQLEDQAEGAGASVLEISPELLEYRDMTYGEFREKSGRVAEFLHGTFYFALLEGQDVCVVFSGEYDEEEAGAVLTDESKCIRLEGRLGELLSGFDSEMEKEEFAAGFVPAGESVPAYHEEEGAGTAYYVADHYLMVEIDSDGDSENDVVLEISLDESDRISPDSYAWIRWEEQL